MFRTIFWKPTDIFHITASNKCFNA